MPRSPSNRVVAWTDRSFYQLQGSSLILLYLYSEYSYNSGIIRILVVSLMIRSGSSSKVAVVTDVFLRRLVVMVSVLLVAGLVFVQQAYSHSPKNDDSFQTTIGDHELLFTSDESSEDPQMIQSRVDAFEATRDRERRYNKQWYSNMSRFLSRDQSLNASLDYVPY